MWFHFRNDWPVRMWPSNSLTRSGYFWILLRGPYTGTWCWRPTGTWSPWVRMTSFQSCPWVSAFSLGRPWCLSSESSGDWGMTQLHKVKLTLFRRCVCFMSYLRLSQSLIMYKAHWQMLKKIPKNPISYFLPFDFWLSVLKNPQHFRFLSSDNAEYLFVFACLFTFFAAPFCMWDLSSLTKDETCTPCIGNAES